MMSPLQSKIKLINSSPTVLLKGCPAGILNVGEWWPVGLWELGTGNVRNRPGYKFLIDNLRGLIGREQK